MNRRIRYWILRWLDGLSWPASLIFEAARAVVTATRHQIPQRA